MHSVLQVTGLELAARTGRRPVGGHPLLLPSSFLAAAGNEIPEACLAPARAGLSVTSISESIGPEMLSGAEAAGNETSDADLARICFGPTRKRGRGPGTGETGTRRPASHPTRPSHSALLTGPAGQASGQHCRGPDRIAAPLRGGAWTGARAAQRTAGPSGRLIPAGLRLATSTTLTVAVRSRRRSRAGLAGPARPGNGATRPQRHELD